MRRTPGYLLSCLLVIPSIISAQGATPPPSSITVSARGEVQVSPDRARVQVGVETQARTSALASQENNRKQTAVLRAIRSLGIPEAQIQTLDFSVSPVQRWDNATKRTVIDGYRVSNIVQVETERLELVGGIVDGALGGGANRVAALEFYIQNRSAAEDSALAKAVSRAKAQAEVAARAAGGSAVELLELTVGGSDGGPPYPMPMAMARMAADESTPTPITPGIRTISTTVTTRWRFTKTP